MTTARSWPESDRARRAAVSSFGVSGTNAHVIIEAAPNAPELSDLPEMIGMGGSSPRGPVNPNRSRRARSGGPGARLVVSAKSEASLRAQIDRIRTRPGDPRDIGHSLITTRTLFEHRAVLLVRQRDHRPGQAHRTRDALHRPRRPTPRHGQATPRPLPRSSRKRSTPAPPRNSRPSSGATDEDLLNQTGNAQPALFAFEVALYRLLQHFGVEAAAPRRPLHRRDRRGTRRRRPHPRRRQDPRHRPRPPHAGPPADRRDDRRPSERSRRLRHTSPKRLHRRRQRPELRGHRRRRSPDRRTRPALEAQATPRLPRLPQPADGPDARRLPRRHRQPHLPRAANPDQSTVQTSPTRVLGPARPQRGPLPRQRPSPPRQDVPGSRPGRRPGRAGRRRHPDPSAGTATRSRRSKPPWPACTSAARGSTGCPAIPVADASTCPPTPSSTRRTGHRSRSARATPPDSASPPPGTRCSAPP